MLTAMTVCKSFDPTSCNPLCSHSRTHSPGSCGYKVHSTHIARHARPVHRPNSDRMATHPSATLAGPARRRSFAAHEPARAGRHCAPHSAASPLNCCRRLRAASLLLPRQLPSAPPGRPASLHTRTKRGGISRAGNARDCGTMWVA